MQHPQTVAPRNSVAQISKLGNRTLRYLEAAIDFDSLELAADHFGTTKAALAKAIRRLEADLGIDLLARDREQVRPTEAEARALEYAAHSRRGLAELLGAIENLRTGAGGVLRIGATIDWVRDVLPGALIELRAQGRRYEAEVTILENNRLHALLSDRVTDLFFEPVSAEECGPDTRFETFAVDWNDVYAGRSNPVHETTVADLSALYEYPWILPGPETYMRRSFVRLFARSGLPAPKPTVESNSVPLIAELAGRGEFLTFLSAIAAHEFDPRTLVRVVLPVPRVERHKGVVMRAGESLSPLQRSLVDTVRNRVAAAEWPGTPVSQTRSDRGDERS